MIAPVLGGRMPMSPDDRRWPWLVYLTVLVPLVGQPIVVLASSVLYSVGAGSGPKAAARINRHAWIAVAMNIVLTLGVLRLVGR